MQDDRFPALTSLLVTSNLGWEVVWPVSKQHGDKADVHAPPHPTLGGTTGTQQQQPQEAEHPDEKPV